MENKKYGNNIAISLFSKKYVIGLKKEHLNSNAQLRAS